MLKFDESSTKALLTKALVQSEASEEIKEKVQVYIHDIFILSPEEFLHNAYLQSLQTCENLLVPDKMYTVTINSIRCEELGLDSTLQHLGEDA